ncbi:putative transporter [wastewater metagenome]|uniref:Putative transporter n=4 Tax=root TaxID=1 RepID=A0A5B8RE19_9ZZZZ|nr:MFS transporter [Arhodomonas aquaeolei]MCS4505478.1 MFS transporter [Arhodomonas aquaeolei]QEA05734.1 putative transporter [uncultured organism]
MTGEPTRQSETLRPNALLTFVMAVACGVAVANIYYAQPLLDTLARDFGVSRGTAGLIITMTQLGYAAGLILLVPLGDLLERRRLITVVSFGTALALAGTALAPGIGIFILCALATGVTAVVAQILVPFAAHLASDAERGRVVGRVMSGLLLGILLARVISGGIADAFGWRTVFALAAALMVIQALVLARLLPRERSHNRMSYGRLLLSVLTLMREEPLLRRRIFYGAMVFAAFSAFWTTMPFLLAGAPYHYNDSVIGLFGLLGVAGALCANLAGHLHDGGRSRAGTGSFLAMIALSFLVMAMFAEQLVAIMVGIILLDLGVQGTQILNQSAIYQLRPEARGRITTAYMTCYFLGGAAGSAAAAYLYVLGGWTGACALGGAFGVLGVLFWLTEFRPGTAARAASVCAQR